MPKRAEIHIQNTAPGPPRMIAPVTPAMLPVPTVDASAVETACIGVISPSPRFGLLEDLADGVLPPVADLGELNEADAEAQVNARADQQCQHDGSPYKAVYRTVDFYDLIHVISLSY